MATTGKFGSSKAFIFVDGYDLRAMHPKSVRIKHSASQEVVLGLGGDHPAQTPTGVSAIEVEQRGGLFDTTAASAHDAFNGSVPTASNAAYRIATVGASGNEIGQEFTGVEGVYSQAYDVMLANDALTKADPTYLVSGRIDRGVILQHLTAKTADWNTKTLGTHMDHTTQPQRTIPITSNSQANPTVVTTPVPHGLATNDVVLIAGVTGSNADVNGERIATRISDTTFSVPVNAGTAAGSGGSFVRASTPNGGAGYLQVTALSGFTGAVIEIRDSEDDSTYAALVTFADVTSAPNAQRVTVSGHVGRYLCVDGDVTGSGSISAFVGFARF